MSSIIFGLFLFTVMVPSTAHAYLDPGSGSAVLQLLLAGLAGAGVAIKFYWRRMMDYFRKSGSQGSNN